MGIIFVTSSGTDIGKTYVSALLLRQLRARGLPARALKPVVSGLDEATFAASDPAALLAALGEPVVYENATWFRAGVSARPSRPTWRRAVRVRK